MRIVINNSHWLVFAVVAVAMSYVLRLVAWWGTRTGERRLADAREALGLPRTTGAAREAATGSKTQQRRR